MDLSLMKKKTLVMVILLLLVTVSLGVATYSWYIVSTAPTIRAIQTYMTVKDPAVSIARASDEFTPPDEVTNRDTAMGATPSGGIWYSDMTWGSVVESFKNNTLVLDYPATFDADEDKLMTATISSTGRVGDLVPLDADDLGYGVEGRAAAPGIRYYTANVNGTKVCAMGIAVWLRINMEGKDLVMSVTNATIKNEDGDVVLNNENVRIMARVLAPQYNGYSDFIPTEYYDNTDTHVAIIYDSDDNGDFPVDEPVLVEVIVYIEGQPDEEEDNDASASQIGLLAKNVSQTLYANIESVSFFSDDDIILNYKKESATGSNGEYNSETTDSTADNNE